MPNLEKFLIELDRSPPEVFTPGERVTGRMYVKSKETTKIKTIMVQLKGEAHVSWSEGSGDDRRSYSARADYADIQKVCLTKEGNQDTFLDTQEYVYPFDFELPLNIPTSFEHLGGYIRYWIQGVIDAPWSLNRYAYFSFTVINKLDLNTMPHLQIAKGATDRKVFCCGPCVSKPVEITIDVQKTGFVPGETLIFNISIDNQSSRKIKAITAMLVEKIKYIARGSTHRTWNDTATLKLDDCQVLPGTQRNFSRLQIKVPPTCPSLMDTCTIIKNEYELRIKVDGSGPCVVKCVSIPIEIGTEPFMGDKVYMTEMRKVDFQPRKSRPNSNDKKIKVGNRLGIYDPFYPVYADMLS